MFTTVEEDYREAKARYSFLVLAQPGGSALFLTGTDWGLAFADDVGVSMLRVRFLHALAVGLVLLLSSMPAGCRSSDSQPLMGAPQVGVRENAEPTFAVGVVPTIAPPIQIGTVVGFRLSSSIPGYGHLYMISATGDVTRLTENLPLDADVQADYPRVGDGIQIRASPPAGIERLIFLVTRQPFAGFANSQGELATRPIALASTAESFLVELNRATAALPGRSWVVSEERVQVVE